MKVFGGLRLNDFQFGSHSSVIVLLFLLPGACQWLSCCWWGFLDVYDGLQFGDPVSGNHVSCGLGFEPVLSEVRLQRCWLVSLFGYVNCFIAAILMLKQVSFGDLFYLTKLAL